MIDEHALQAGFVARIIMEILSTKKTDEHELNHIASKYELVSVVSDWPPAEDVFAFVMKFAEPHRHALQF